MRWLWILLLIWPAATVALEPEEMLSDPALEARARELSKELRCLVCRNESIDESNAELARDLRRLLRTRLSAGDTDEEAIDFIVARYGEYVLLRPQAQGSTLLLWAAGPAMLVLGGAMGAVYIRRRASVAEQPSDELSEEETQRLQEILERDA